MYIVGSEGYLAGGTIYDPEGNEVQKLSGRNANHFDNFIQAVRSRKREELNAEITEGHTSTALVHVANISQRLGKPASPKEIQQALGAREGTRERLGVVRGNPQTPDAERRGP